MKNVITTLALLAASSALASAATVTVDVVSLAASSTIASTEGTSSTLSGQGSSYSQVTTTAADVASILGSKSTGLYYGSGNGNNGSKTAAEVDTTATPNAYTLTQSWSYQAYNGFWNALVVSVADILEESETATVDDLTSLSISYTVTGLSLSVWTITDGTATQVLYVGGTETCSTTGAYGTAVVNTVSAAVSAAVSNLDEDSTIVIIYGTNGNNEGSGTVTVTTTIPEPSTFGLLAGVGALALVASRRRRSRKA